MDVSSRSSEHNSDFKLIMISDVTVWAVGALFLRLD